MSEPVLTEDQRDALQEVANLAMGQAATRLARLLDSFIELSVPRVRVVAVSEAAQAVAEKAKPVRTGPKVGRNDPCPCGSGKKFKHCCGR